MKCGVFLKSRKAEATSYFDVSSAFDFPIIVVWKTDHTSRGLESGKYGVQRGILCGLKYLSPVE